jgi:hypothetical protein
MSEVWPADRQLSALTEVGPTLRAEAEPMAAPGTYPVPGGRGRWRVTVHNRNYTGVSPATSIISEVPDARSRRLSQKWNDSAQFDFVLEGHSASAGYVDELQTEVIAWRWDDQTGKDVAMFRGPVGQSQDTISEQSATVQFTCHDYMAMLARRFSTPNTDMGWAATDQDYIASGLIYYWGGQINDVNNNPRFQPGAYIPLFAGFARPDGSDRTGNLSGVLRDRMYPGSTNIMEALKNLAACTNGFDFDCKTWGLSKFTDNVRIFYPYQGVTRTDVVLRYGTTLSGLQRTFNSADYANYQRINGNKQSTAQSAPQMIAEVYTADASIGTAGAVGLWMNAANESDVTVQQTLNDHANAALNRSSVIVGGYNVTMRPGYYSYGNPNMGDVVQLVVQEGRLNISTQVRVLGIDYDIGDDGDETVKLTVGRPVITLGDLFAANKSDVNALARR